MVVERRNRVLKRCRFGRLIRVQAFDANRVLVLPLPVDRSVQPTGRHTAISGLMAEMPSAPGLSARLLSRFQNNTYVLLQQFLDKAAAEGRAADGVDARLFLDRRLVGINCFSGHGPASSLPEQVMRHAA